MCQSDLLHRGALAAEEILADIFRIPVDKAIDPLSSSGFVTIQARLAAALSGAASDAMGPKMRAAINSLDVDWKNLTDEGRENIIRAARETVKSAVGPRVLPAIHEKLVIAGTSIVGDSKKAMRRKYKLDVAVSLDDVDQNIVKHAASSQAFYVRDALGRRIDSFGDKARGIVSGGLEKGLGREAIAKELGAALADAGRPDSYWQLISGVYANRSRTFGQLRAMSSAGIDSYTFHAVMDTLTSEVCRFMHGRRFTVKHALDRYSKVARSSNPEAVLDVQPWLQKGKDENGAAVLYYKQKGQRVQVAQVDASGEGEIDKSGSYSSAHSDADLEKAGVSVPPLHGHAILGCTPVTTSRGVIAANLVRPGDFVITHRGHWRSVTAIRQKLVRNRPIRFLLTTTGRILGITHEHPVLVSDFGWKRAGDLDPGDVLLEHAQKVARIPGGGVLPNTQNSPAVCDQKSISHQISLATPRIPMILPVDLDTNALTDEGDVQYKPSDVVLCDGPEGRKEIENVLFLRSQSLAKAVCYGGRDAFSNLVDTGWVRASHLLAPAGGWVILAAEAEGPVRFASRPGSEMLGAVVRDLNLVVARSDSNSVTFAPSAQRSFAETVLALDGAERSTLLDVLHSDQIRSVFANRQRTQFHAATILYIVDGRYDGDLIDFSVADDESYTAAGLVVHNCRSVILHEEGSAGVSVSVPEQLEPEAPAPPPREPAHHPKVASLLSDAHDAFSRADAVFGTYNERGWDSDKQALDAAGKDARVAVRGMISHLEPDMNSYDVDRPGRAGDRMHFKKYMDSLPNSAAAIHDWNGAVHIASSKPAKLAESLKLAKDGRMVASPQIEDIELLLHEEMHGHSPVALAPRSYSGIGASIEEATTEVVARNMTKRILALQVEKYPNHPGLKLLGLPEMKRAGDSGWSMTGAVGPYGHVINSVVQRYGQVTGDYDGAAAAVEKAMLKSRRVSPEELIGRGVKEPFDVLSLFIEGTGLSEGKKAELEKALMEDKTLKEPSWIKN